MSFHLVHHHDPHHTPTGHIHTYHEHQQQAQNGGFRLKRITDCTIEGQDLRVRETKMIATKLGFQLNEEIEIIYSKSDQFESYFELHDQCLVGLTNYRIFKIEKGSITQTFLHDIVSVSHQKNGIFAWDKVDCKLSNGEHYTFGIYEGKTCAFFVQHVQNHIKNRSTSTFIYPNGPTPMQPLQPMFPNTGMIIPQPATYSPIDAQPQYHPGYGSAPPSTNPPPYAPQ